MVILPTEKRFDWQHAPVVLAALVVLNVLIFFFYQSGDNEKLANAFMYYEEGELFPIEWPLYEAYLHERGDDELADEYRTAVDGGYAQDVAIELLLDSEFNQYLKDNYREVVPDKDYRQWSAGRPVVNSTLESISFYRLGLIPNRLSIVDLFAHQFLHGDSMHLLGNLFFLLVCGFAVEAAIGHLRFLLFYLITGVVGGLSHALVDLSSGGPLVGASGAISGVMAMYLGVFRLRKIEFFYWFFVFVGYFRAPALLILPIYIGKEVVDFLSNDGSNVAYMAHAGGFIAGGLCIAVALWINPQTINEEYVETDQSTNDYQEKLAKISKSIEGFQFKQALKQVEAIINEFGLNFQLGMLRYNLGKIHEPQDFAQWVLDLLSMKSRDPHELAKIKTVWQENPEIAGGLDTDRAIDLGMRFSNPDHFVAAEQIFATLRDKAPGHPQLPILAMKLAEVAKQQRDVEKQRAYLQFAKIAPGIQGGGLVNGG